MIKDDSPQNSFQGLRMDLLLHQGWRPQAAPAFVRLYSCHTPVSRFNRVWHSHSLQIKDHYLCQQKFSPCAYEPKGSGTAHHLHQLCGDFRTNLQWEERGDATLSVHNPQQQIYSRNCQKYILKRSIKDHSTNLIITPLNPIECQ